MQHAFGLLLALGGLSGSFLRPTAACGDELLAHWPLDEVANGVAKDASGHGHDGRIVGTKVVPGAVSGALWFDGQKDHVLLGDFGQREAFTLAFWVKPEESAGSNDWRGLVTSDGLWEQGVLHVSLRARQIDIFLHAGTRRRVHLTSHMLSIGQWHHIALTADTRRRSLQLFVNGVEVDSGGIPPEITRVNLNHQVLGRESDGKKPQRYFRGAIDDVRIYARALEASAIKALCPQAVPTLGRDRRNLLNGYIIPHEGYCDQPYVVITRDGNWLCTLTTGPGNEGQRGQHIISTISTDKGCTWSPPVDIEPSGELEASWVVPLVTPSGRVYVFYTYNGDNVRELKGKPIRADTIGWYACKYSDDHGRTWSRECFRLPLRVTACDRGNDFQGKVQIFWGIDKPNVVDGTAYFAFTKLGKFMLEMGEGWFFRCDNILAEPDVKKLHWKLLPEGEHGLRLPEFGSVQEEHNIVPLSTKGGFYCVYRTTLGHPCHAYSYDGCCTWTQPEFMTYSPGGRKMKTPRACPMLWRTASGKYLFWYHNNGGKNFSLSNRNPVWISGGLERDGKLYWSQPEILLFDPNTKHGMSYPDLIEQDGRYWVTETQKKIARVHEIDRSLLEGLWSQGQVSNVAHEGLLVDAGPELLRTGSMKLDGGLDLRKTGGMSVDLWLKFDELKPGQAILDAWAADGKGFALATADHGTLRLDLADGAVKDSWDTDPGVLQPGRWHHVVVIVDIGPGVISFVVDGVLCDGGEARDCGWGRLQGEYHDLSGSRPVRVSTGFHGEMARVRIYGRPLRISEAVANYHAGKNPRLD